MNGMYMFYIIALIPSLIGLALYFIGTRVNFIEWAWGTGIAFAVAAIMNLFAYTGMISDTEIWSGKVSQINKYPFWVEEYQVAIYRNERYYDFLNEEWKTREVFSHHETRHRNHSQYFTKAVWLGTDSKEFRINESEWNDVVKKFGGEIETIIVRKSGFDGGDPNNYVCINKTDFIIPAAITKSWNNKVKASPSSFSFVNVPENAPVFEYPQCLDIWHSDRLMGDAIGKIDPMKFDQLNAKLGPTKKVNLIIVGFNSADANLGKLQEAKWIGGKKNDIVICYGYAPLEGNIPNVCWTYCFSWCKNDEMKRNIEKIFYESIIDDTILPKLEEQIVNGYQKREWSEFDKLTVKPRPIHYYILLGLMLISQIGLYIFFLKNDVDKGE